MSKQKQQWNLELLEKENASLKEQLKDSEEYAEQLEAEFTALKEKKFDTGKNIGVILSGALESLVRNNTSLLKRIPGGQALAGLIEDDNKRLEVSAGDEVVASRETAASFKRKSSQGNRGVEDEININNVEKQSAETGLDALLVYQLQQLQQVIPPGDNRDKLHSILQVFAGNPHLIIDVWGLFDEACRQQAFHEVTKQNNTVHTGTNANESTGTQTSSDSGKEQLNKKRL